MNRQHPGQESRICSWYSMQLTFVVRSVLLKKLLDRLGKSWHSHSDSDNSARSLERIEHTFTQL